MLWELGNMDMHTRLLREKLLLYYHLQCLPETSVAHQMLKILEDLHLPSLRGEIEDFFLAKFDISDVQMFQKKDGKNLLRKPVLS